MIAGFLALVLPAIASGARVYTLSGGDPASDNAVRQALQNPGHYPNLGIQTPDFDGTQVKLADFDVVVALYNQNWSRPITAAGKSALQSYLLDGGRLVTAEWFIDNLTGDTTLGPLLPATRDRAHRASPPPLTLKLRHWTRSLKTDCRPALHFP